MKREYTDQGHNQERNIFTKLHHNTTTNHHHPHFPHHHLTTSEEEADSHNFLAPPQPPPPPASDGATIELAGRRPRGRPPGSKNKPKPPVIITQASLTNPHNPPMSPYVLELPPGVDIVESTTRFCRKRDMGLCVLNGNGAVANVTLKQPSPAGATVTFHGKFDVLSMSATVLPRDGSRVGFAVSLAGPQGQVVGGHVVGPLVSAGTVYLIAASFNNPAYHRLGDVDEVAAAGGGDGGHESPPHAAVSGGDSGAPSAGVSGGGVAPNMFSSYQPSDVIWAPSARQQPPPPSPPY